MPAGTTPGPAAGPRKTPLGSTLATTMSTVISAMSRPTRQTRAGSCHVEDDDPAGGDTVLDRVFLGEAIDRVVNCPQAAKKASRAFLLQGYSGVHLVPSAPHYRSSEILASL